MNNYDSINEEMMAGVDEVGRGPLDTGEGIGLGDWAGRA